MSTRAHPATTHPDLGLRRPPLAAARRVFQGDLVSARVILAIAVIWIIFQSQNDRFLSAVNLTNLALQITATGLISVGVVFVLLLGEIDLSVGAVSGVTSALMAGMNVQHGWDPHLGLGAAVSLGVAVGGLQGAPFFSFGVTSALMAVMNVQHGWNPYLAIGAAIALGLAIGVLQGALFSSFGVPSFIITLAGLLAWQGLQLYILGDTGSVNVTNGTIVGLANHFYSDALGWVFAAVVIAAYAATTLGSLRSRRAGLADIDAAGPIARIVIMAAATNAVVAVLNAEAARRAGIRTRRIRIIVFGISGTMAAIGGVLAASRLLAVDQSSGGSDLLLFAIAGPVIAGTSLFGGRGSVWSALLGAITIGSISNGMDLLALQSSVKFMVTGGVLVAAVVVDALARRSRQARA